MSKVCDALFGETHFATVFILILLVLFPIRVPETPKYSAIAFDLLNKLTTLSNRLRDVPPPFAYLF